MLAPLGKSSPLPGDGIENGCVVPAAVGVEQDSFVLGTLKQRHIVRTTVNYDGKKLLFPVSN